MYAFDGFTIEENRPIRGNINLYSHTVVNHSGTYYFKRFYYLEKDGELTKITKRKFKKLLKKLVASYPELQAKIGKRGYRFRSMAKIVQEFNEYNTNIALQR